jgi:predicted dehydrogenase
MLKIAMLGSGFIADFYTMSLHGQRNKDRVHVVYGRNEERLNTFCKRWDIPKSTTNMEEAVADPEVDVVIVSLPNNLHLETARLCARHKKAIFCTKPLARTAAEAKEMMELVESAGIVGGYLEDLVYTPKTLKSLDAVRNGAVGRVLWARSRETHPGPHSDWFWNKETAGGGAIIDLGCHCIEIARNYIGKEVRPVEVMCWADTLVKPIEAEDHAVGLVRYENGSIGQFEVSWAFRGGMDLRDEVAGTEGTIWNNHFLRTGFEMFTTGNKEGYVAEKAESNSGWLFPVGDEVNELGYNHMFTDMFNAYEGGRQPMETFYDGYVVNAIMDAAYRSAASKRWEPVQLDVWRGSTTTAAQGPAVADYNEQYFLIKEEITPDGRKKTILKDKKTGEIIQKVDQQVTA